MAVRPENQKRSLSVIAQEIRKEWPKMSVHAAPYVNAMECVADIRDSFYSDSAEYIVRYFLNNAGSWRGEAAKRIKAELKGMLK